MTAEAKTVLCLWPGHLCLHVCSSAASHMQVGQDVADGVNKTQHASFSTSTSLFILRHSMNLLDEIVVCARAHAIFFSSRTVVYHSCLDAHSNCQRLHDNHAAPHPGPPVIFQAHPPRSRATHHTLPADATPSKPGQCGPVRFARLLTGSFVSGTAAAARALSWP